MTAEEYFNNYRVHSSECAGLDMLISEEDFMKFAELKEQDKTKRLTELKNQTELLLDHIIRHEWNISGPGLTRIKEFMATLNASK